jgi:hypothetical protein
MAFAQQRANRVENAHARPRIRELSRLHLSRSNVRHIPDCVSASSFWGAPGKSQSASV